MNWRNRPRQSCPDVCDTILSLLSLQADGMASADESRRVDLHLKTCDDCRRAQSWMQATHLAIAQRPLVAPPPDLRARIAQAVAAQAAPVVFTTRRPLVLRPAFAVAASLALAAAWVGHSLLTTPAPEPTVEPTAVATVPRVTPPMFVPPVRSVTVPPKVAVKPAPPMLPRVLVKPIERLATTKDTAPSRIVIPKAAFSVPAPRPMSRPATAPHAPLIAKAPAPAAVIPAKPHPAAISEPKIAHMAIVPKPAPLVTVPDVTPPTTVSPEPAPTVVAINPVAPAPTPEPTPIRVARRDDALSVVRAHLTSSQSDNEPRHISRDSRVQAASYAADGGLTPYYGMVYTPTHQDH